MIHQHHFNTNKNQDENQAEFHVPELIHHIGKEEVKTSEAQYGKNIR